MPLQVRPTTLTRLLTFSCPHCRQLNTVKVYRLVDFSTLAARTLVCASCSESFTEVLMGPVVEGPFRKTMHVHKAPRRQTSAEYRAITVNKQSVSEDAKNATLMLRLGASENSIRTAWRMLAIARKTEGLVSSRDLSWTLRMTILELKEAADTLLRPNLSLIFENARRGGASEAEIKEISMMLDRAPQSFYSRILNRAANWITSHSDNLSFEDWTKTAPGDSMVWMVREREREGSTVHVAAAAAAIRSIVPNGTSDELNLCVVEVIECSSVLVRVFQCAVAGFLSRHGVEDLPLHGPE
jgi:hypothetical protein